MSVPTRALMLFLSLSSLGAGLFLASAHPIAPLLVTFTFIALIILFLWQPQFGLVALPILLPLLNFSPWTGWLIVDEFDLLVLAVVAAGFFHQWRDHLKRDGGRVFFLLLVMVVLLVTRGSNELAVRGLDWFSGYTSPLNSIRVGKSLLWAVLLSPLILNDGTLCLNRQESTGFFRACLLGSCVVVMAAFWERSFYPGLLDISTPYRTTALFWEMHLGGAALDAYLVLIAPLLVWAWRTTESIRGRLVLGAFALAFAYVCLTTFSRGVIGAIAGSLVVLGTLLVFRHKIRENASLAFRLTSAFILLLVFLEVAFVLGTDSFMNKRLAASDRDLKGRLQHWEQGIGLLNSVDDWLFGIGLGQLPSRMTQGESGRALPGDFSWNEQAGRPTMVVKGPNRFFYAHNTSGLYALSQRVDLVSLQRYRFAMDGRSDQNVEILVQVCAMHLLYSERCQHRRLRLNAGHWPHWESRLSGPVFQAGSWLNAAHGVFMLSVITPGASVELKTLGLFAGTGGNELRNSQFNEKGAGWFPAAHSYFLPWHIDNLYLEFLIETGIIGLTCFLAVVLLSIRRLFAAYARGNTLAPYFIASISGLMALGLVVSVVDMPRVALLFFLMLLWAWRIGSPSLPGFRKIGVRSALQN